MANAPIPCYSLADTGEVTLFVEHFRGPWLPCNGDNWLVEMDSENVALYSLVSRFDACVCRNSAACLQSSSVVLKCQVNSD